ncbi:MAG TPA: DUF2461 domain-containing protein [Mycobacteriales bacterium]|nr:DUF2461 domain-containing protein [Mycobacteriales bacterium]
MSDFRGFPERALIFFEGLEADNSKPYWTDHKDVYEEHVRAPMLALLAELEAEFGTGKMFRPYRDVRFSKDKTPYKTQAAAMVESYYLSLSADGLFLGGGVYHPAPDQLERLRRAVADDVQGAALSRIVGSLEKAGYEVGGDRMTRPPRGYAADHPRIELLKHRSLVASRHWEPEPWLHTRAAYTRVRDAWRGLAPLNDWLHTNVGASDQPRR